MAGRLAKMHATCDEETTSWKFNKQFRPFRRVPCIELCISKGTRPDCPNKIKINDSTERYHCRLTRDKMKFSIHLVICIKNLLRKLWGIAFHDANGQRDGGAKWHTVEIVLQHSAISMQRSSFATMKICFLTVYYYCYDKFSLFVCIASTFFMGRSHSLYRRNFHFILLLSVLRVVYNQYTIFDFFYSLHIYATFSQQILKGTE